MILADFTGVNNHYHHHENNTKHNSNLQKTNSNILSFGNSALEISYNMNTINTKTVSQYINQLDIPGVGQAYTKKQQQKLNQLNRTIQNERQQYLQQSINRLYSTGMNRTVNNGNKNNNKNSNDYQQSQQSSQHNHHHYHNNSQSKPYYNQLYEQDKQFDYQFRVKKLENDCNLMYKKLLNNFINKYHLWVAKDEKDRIQKQYKKKSLKPSDVKAKCKVIVLEDVRRMFIKSLINFFINFTLPSSQSDKNNTNFMTLQDEFLIAYSDFLNHHKFKQWINNIQLNNHLKYDHQIQQNIKLQARKLPFVYFFINYSQFQKLDKSKIKTMKDVEQWVIKCLDRQRQWGKIYNVFKNEIQVRFTVPFQTRLYEVKNKGGEKDNKNQKQQQQDDQQIQTFKSFKANPIPSSTYQKPKQSQSFSQTKKPPTQPIPFNFTQPHSSTPKITKQQYYSWNRQFKAKPIPKTLYQPQLIGIGEKDRQLQKKQHKQKLFNEARFPKTMGYLQNFNQFQQQKIKQLQGKYQQNRLQQRARPKPIPDFDKMHKRDMYQLQARKQMNRTCTQPKPFKFTQTKKSDMKNTFKNNTYDKFQFQKDYDKQIKNKKKLSSKDTSSIPEAKTTAKFDAYVLLRKQQKQNKRKQIQQKQQMKKRKQQDKKKYKDILKQRMQNQLSNQPKAVQYNNNNNSTNNNMVKVDLQEIYIARPLLMQSSMGKNNNGQKKNDDTRTCFTDSYQPII